MGLDMYLLKGTKVAGATIEDYLTAMKKLLKC